MVLVGLQLPLANALIDPNQHLPGNVLTVVHPWAGEAAGCQGGPGPGWRRHHSASCARLTPHLPVSKPNQNSDRSPQKLFSYTFPLEPLPSWEANTALIFFPPFMSFSCSRTSYIWDHMVCSLLCPTSFTLHVCDSSMLFHVLVVCSFLLLKNITLYNYHS